MRTWRLPFSSSNGFKHCTVGTIRGWTKHNAFVNGSKWSYESNTGCFKKCSDYHAMFRWGTINEFWQAKLLLPAKWVWGNVSSRNSIGADRLTSCYCPKRILLNQSPVASNYCYKPSPTMNPTLDFVRVQNLQMEWCGKPWLPEATRMAGDGL